jgi:ABC-type branched-subunit amino acid transport system permease subunit
VMIPEILDGFSRTVGLEMGRMAPIRQGIFGLLVVVFLLYEPHGLARSWRRLTHFGFLKLDALVRRQRH